MLDSLLTIPNELTQTERELIFEYYKNMPEDEQHDSNRFDIDLKGRPTFFVKHGPDKDESAPGIPEVYDAFHHKEGYCFLVMEKVELPMLGTCEISEDDAVQSVASAVKWLFAQLPSVPTSIFGRISSELSCVWHGVFKDQEAPVYFVVHADALTKYINKTFSRCPGKLKRSVSFSNDLAIYHSDIRKDNFLHDIKTGKIWIVDFQHIGVLPKPFQTYAFFNTGNRFAAAVGRHPGHQPSDVANLLIWAAEILQMTARVASLNLDKFGKHIPRRDLEYR